MPGLLLTMSLKHASGTSPVSIAELGMGHKEGGLRGVALSFINRSLFLPSQVLV
ncbi:MAG: hypothetical protein RMJ84_10320 [Sandaracinaceae bacterium]|nr:hypothetical protein [Sandaracinaceae bacterium]